MYMKFGIEVELATSRSLRIGTYSSPSPLIASWLGKTDSSVNALKTGFVGGQEIINNVWKAKKREEIKEVVSREIEFLFEEIYAQILSKDLLKKVELRTVHYDFRNCVEFNRTMGAHLHFSFYEDDGTQMLITLSETKAIRNEFSKRLRTIEPLERRKEFYSHYFRAYSVKQGSVYLVGRKEFHSTASKGYEWRAFNLMGTTTARQIITRVTTAFEAMWDVMEHRIKKPVTVQKHSYRPMTPDSYRMLTRNRYIRSGNDVKDFYISSQLCTAGDFKIVSPLVKRKLIKIQTPRSYKGWFPGLNRKVLKLYLEEN